MTDTTKIGAPYSHFYGKIFGTHPKFGPVHIADVRGWGFFTGHGHAALGLGLDAGLAAQDALGEQIVAALNVAEKPAGE